jgi:DNA ligase-4
MILIVCKQLPKSAKGTSCRNALSHFQESSIIWAETKYDGERTQIHVRILPDGSSDITIFSKSKRDSTGDRLGLHDIIREALGLGVEGSPHHHSSCSGRSCRIKNNIVLDAEMVAWYKDHIDGMISNAD